MSSILAEIHQGGSITNIRLVEENTHETQQKFEKTLLSILFPDTEVVRVQLPNGMFDEDQLTRIRDSVIDIGYTKYARVLTRKAVKRNELYLVDSALYPEIQRRFRQSLSRADDDFETLVSPCKGLVDLPDARILIVKEGGFGVREDQGWVRRSLCVTKEHFHWLSADLNDEPFCQFVMSFGQTQAAGAFKLMPDNVADSLDADFIIPDCSVTPIDEAARIQPSESFRRLRGRVVLGITEVPGYCESMASGLLESMPASAVANDSFILLNEDGILCYGCGWLPVSSAIGPRFGIFAQYQIVPDDLLAFEFLDDDQISDMLIDQQENCFTQSEFDLILRQLRLEATCVLRPETAVRIRRELE
jgi:hypothetical protein